MILAVRPAGVFFSPSWYLHISSIDSICKGERTRRSRLLFQVSTGSGATVGLDCLPFWNLEVAYDGSLVTGEHTLRCPKSKRTWLKMLRREGHCPEGFNKTKTQARVPLALLPRVRFEFPEPQYVA